MAGVTVGETFDREHFQGVVDSMHGGLRQVTPVPIPVSIENDPVRKAEYYQNPVYRYIFNDGTYIDARADDESGDAIQIVKYQVSPSAQRQATAEEKTPTLANTPKKTTIENGEVVTRDLATGSILEQRPATKAELGATGGGDENVSAPSNVKNIVRRVDGQLVTEPNPNYVPPNDEAESSVSAPTTAPFIIRRVNGELVREENPNYVEPKDPNQITEYQRQQLDLQKRTADRADAAANKPEKPTVVNTSSKDKYITTMDSEGNVSSQANPSYDAALAQYEQQKERLSTAMTLGQMTAVQAKNDLDRWFTINVDIPFKQSAEARARAAEIRMAQEAEDRRQQFSANYGMQRSNAGLLAGQNAVDNEMDMMQYRTGPAFGDQFAAGVNALSKGTTEGINFTKDAFTFKAPNLEKIAAKATANALKHISPAAAALASGAGQQPDTTVDYSGIPTGPTTPPPPPSGFDMNALIQQAMGQYQPGAAPAPPMEATQPWTPTTEELAAMGVG